MRASAPPPVASVHATMADSQVVPGALHSCPGRRGQAAVAIPAVGYRRPVGSRAAVPVASMTKVMTAYIVLHDHPLAPGQNGPDVTITRPTTADYATDTVTDQANVLVQAGEVLTERQVLEGMLVHSANNFGVHPGLLGRRIPAGLRGQDERHRRRARHDPDPLRRRQRVHTAVHVDRGRPVEGGHRRP